MVGWKVEDSADPEVREVLYRGYRIIYQYRDGRVDILAVRHGSRLWQDDILESD